MTLVDGQLFLNDDAASIVFCINPATGAFTMSVKGMFVGGLGKLAGAKGTYEYKGAGQVLLTDKFGMPFGGFEVETDGKFVLPK
jgi:hypothetical protein